MCGGGQWRGSSREPSGNPYRPVRHHYQACLSFSHTHTHADGLFPLCSEHERSYNELVLVRRLNNAPVFGFERDAGSRTTIRLMYPEGAPHSADEYKQTSLVALVVFKSLDLAWLTSVITKQPLVSRCRQFVKKAVLVCQHAMTDCVVFDRASGPNCGSGGRWWMKFPWVRRTSASSIRRLCTRPDKSCRNTL